MLPELHSPTVTDLITANMYEYIRKMKEYINVCLTSYQMILLMKKTIFISYHIIMINVCTRVMALDLGQNFIFAQYLENKLTFFSPNFIYAFILTRSSFGLLHILFAYLYQS